MQVFGDLERLAASLYPLRVPIAVGAFALLAAILVVGYRFGWHRLLGRHRVWTGAAGIVLLAMALPVGNYLLSPLWTQSTLAEAAPTTSGPDLSAARITHRGEFVGADEFHFGRGRALLAEVSAGRYALRVEEFSVRNGPDLFVYLSPSSTGYTDGAVNLGRLKATDGAFNYDVPEGTDISRVRSVVVWCRQFAVLFATAALTAA